MVEQAGRIVVSGLTKTFGATPVVHDLSFTVEPGSIAGFLGPNGAGKTTTLRMLLGLVTPDAGSATIGGLRYAARPRPAGEVGALLDSSGFHPRRSGRSHLRLYCAVNGYPGRRAEEVLAIVGLADVAGRPVRGYSLGIALPWLSAKGVHVTLTGGAMPGVLATVIIAVVIYSLIGAGLAAVVRDQVTTVVVLLVYLFAIEPIVTRIPGLASWAIYLPGPAANAFTQTHQAALGYLRPWQGGILFAGYVAAAAAAGLLLTVRRDVT